VAVAGGTEGVDKLRLDLPWMWTQGCVCRVVGSDGEAEDVITWSPNMAADLASLDTQPVISVLVCCIFVSNGLWVG
jgi:hypothetical protein